MMTAIFSGYGIIMTSFIEINPGHQTDFLKALKGPVYRGKSGLRKKTLYFFVYISAFHIASARMKDVQNGKSLRS